MREKSDKEISNAVFDKVVKDSWKESKKKLPRRIIGGALAGGAFGALSTYLDNKKKGQPVKTNLLNNTGLCTAIGSVAAAGLGTQIDFESSDLKYNNPVQSYLLVRSQEEEQNEHNKKKTFSKNDHVVRLSDVKFSYDDDPISNSEDRDFVNQLDDRGYSDEEIAEKYVKRVKRKALVGGISGGMVYGSVIGAGKRLLRGEDIKSASRGALKGAAIGASVLTPVCLAAGNKKSSRRHIQILLNKRKELELKKKK